MALEIAQRQVAALQALGARLIDSRKPRSPLGEIARELLLGAWDVLAYAGRDDLLDALAAQHGVDVADRAALADHGPLAAALVGQLEAIDLDGGGPRNQKPGQLASCVVAALGLTVVEDGAPVAELGDDVRRAVAAAIAAVAEVELAAPKMREAIVEDARARTEERFQGAFGKVAAQLDDRALHVLKTPKVPVDALHAAQQALYDARTAYLDRVARAALDAAQPVLARANPEVAAGLERPVTSRSTPREVAALRLRDFRVAKNPTHAAHSLIESVTELLRIAWRAPDQVVHPYSASRTFAVGDVIEHPKLGRGTVVAAGQRIDVEFAEGKRTLVHAPAKRG